jgi:membrane protease YdiL (CAAX protease family)
MPWPGSPQGTPASPRTEADRGGPSINWPPGSAPPNSGQAGSGQAGSGQAGSGQASSGQPRTGQTGDGQASNGQASNGQASNGPAGYAPAANWPGYDGGNGRALQPRDRQIPARAALVAVPGALGGIVLAGVGAAIGEGITGSSTSGVSDLLGEAGLWVAMLATVVFVSYRFGTASLPRDYGLAIKAKDPLWGVCAAIMAFVAAGLVLEIFSGTKFSGSNDQIITQQKGHEAGIVLVTLIVALGAPFFEELFFRGYLRTALQARFGRHGAVWLQAVFFGLAHTGEAGTALGNVSVVLAMITVGVVLGYTAMLTGRLGAGMVAHCLFNLVAVISVV